MLAVDSVAEDERRCAFQHVPVAPIADRQAWKVSCEIAALPGLPVSALLEPLKQRLLHEPGAGAGQVSQRDAHSSRGTRRAKPVDGDVGAALGAERLPDQLAQELRVAPARGALDHPAKEVAIRRNVVQR